MKAIKYIYLFLALSTVSTIWGQSLIVNSSPGLQLQSNGPLQLVFNNAGIVSNGNFAAGKGTTVSFRGTSATGNSFIGGNGSVSFYNLLVNKKANDLLLENNISINGDIILEKGNLQLNNNILDLGNTGKIVGERNDARITGPNGGLVKATALLRSPLAINPGNIGVEITSPANLGTTVITRGHMTQVSATGEQSIQRYFNITPEINTNLQATLRFWYFDAETGVNDKTMLTFYARKNATANWSLKGRDNSDISDNWVIKNNLDQLNSYTLAKNVSNLPRQKDAKDQIQVYPNPYYDHFTIALFNEVEKDDIINIYDQTGHRLQSKQVHWYTGMNTVDWSEGKYAAGTYYLTLSNSPGKLIKIVKL